MVAQPKIFSFVLCVASLYAMKLDTISPARRRAENAVPLPTEILGLVMAEGGLSDLLAWSSVSKGTRGTALPLLLSRYGRLDKSGALVKPDISKILLSTYDLDEETRDGFAQFHSCNMADLAPEAVIEFLLSKPSRISEIPYFITLMEELKNQAILKRLLAVGTSLAESVLCRVVERYPELVDEASVWYALKSGCSSETFEMMATCLADPLPMLLAYDIRNGLDSSENLFSMIMGLTVIPSELMTAMLNSGMMGLVKTVCEERQDIVVDCSDFWIQLLDLDNPDNTAIVELLQGSNPIPTSLIMQPDAIRTIMPNFPNSLVPLLIHVYQRSGRSPCHLATYLQSKSFSTTEAYKAACACGAPEQVCLLVVLSTHELTPLQMEEALIEFSGLDGTDHILDRWLGGFPPHIAKYLFIHVLKRKPQLALPIVQTYCRKFGWTVQHLLEILRLAWRHQQTLPVIMKTIAKHYSNAKRDLLDRNDFFDSVLEFMGALLKSGKPEGLEIVGALRNEIISWQGAVDRLEEHVQEDISGTSDFFYLVFWPHINKSTFTKGLRDSTIDLLTLGKACIMLKVPPAWMNGLLLRAHRQHLLGSLVLLALSKPHTALIVHLQKHSVVTKNCNLVVAYIRRDPCFCPYGLVKLLRSFDFGSSNPSKLINSCLLKHMPEEIMSYLMRTFGLINKQMKMPHSSIVAAGLDENYSDWLVHALLSSASPNAPHTAAILLHHLSRSDLERGAAFMERLRVLARSHSPSQVISKLLPHKKSSR